MNILEIKSAAEQVADYLRAEIASRTWGKTMPGETQLLNLLGVGRNTIKQALTLLEQQGVIINQGPNRRRVIAPVVKQETRSLRIGILCYEENSKADSMTQQIISSFRERKHHSFVASETLHSLRRDVKRLSRYIEENQADAWILNAASRPITEWFLNEGIPTFSIYGAQLELPIAGIGADHNPAIIAAVQKLIQLGHRRIVLLSNRGRHDQLPREAEKSFLMELKSNGIKAGGYNLPSWEDRQGGFQKCLEVLFQHTPPTAVIIEEATHFFACLQFCGQRHLSVPEDVSLVCSEYSPNFDFLSPSVSHMAWDTGPMVRRVQRWVDNIASGKEDKRQSRIKVKFHPADTMGQASLK